MRRKALTVQGFVEHRSRRVATQACFGIVFADFCGHEVHVFLNMRRLQRNIVIGRQETFGEILVATARQA